jgi:2,4-diketo-3-deoxy-L-fuconate hydrolase
MKFANIGGRACIVREHRAMDIAAVSRGELASDPAVYTSVDRHPQLLELAHRATERDFVDFSPADVGPPVPRPGKVIAVALNYRSHAEETSRVAPDEPVVCAKVSSAICGPFDAIEVAPEWVCVDYEAEIVVVIGARLRHVNPDEVWSRLAGVTGGQDVSDRVEQFREPLRQFSFAKSYDTFAPIGPFLATIDELPDPDDVELIGWVDGLEVQHATTKELITGIPALIAWISTRMTLDPGDLVFTGTPAGVGSRRSPPLYLRAGMTLGTEIPGVGTMRNPICERRRAAQGSAAQSERSPVT